MHVLRHLRQICTIVTVVSHPLPRQEVPIQFLPPEEAISQTRCIYPFKPTITSVHISILFSIDTMLPMQDAITNLPLSTQPPRLPHPPPKHRPPKPRMYKRHGAHDARLMRHIYFQIEAEIAVWL